MNWSFALRIIVAMIGMANSKVQAKLGKKASADIGILSSSHQRHLGPSTCRNGFLICTNGMFYNGNAPPGTTCAEYCNGQCCVGENACDGFSGTICRDRKTCVGKNSCRGARIGLVGNACRGADACLYAGAADGTINAIERSCVGDNACYNTANGGDVRVIADGCNADNACEGVAMNNPDGIALIRDACNDVHACSYLAGYQDIGGDLNGTTSGSGYVIEDCCNSNAGCAGVYELPAECGNGDAPAPAPGPGPAPSCNTYGNKKICESNFCTWTGSGKNAACIDPVV
mmetsp:Transcript_8851/g.14791  ORF Transcript_8851/g.14791 Transcript_8851/m.14791 type:complete len:287 (-) Transcript_8851:109-969(-)